MKFAQYEIEAVQASLPAVGQHVAEAGIGTKAFNDLSKDEVLALVAKTVVAFRKASAEILDEQDIPF